VYQNYPNPFTGTTAIDIGLPADAHIEIDVFDVGGRVVRRSAMAGVKGWSRFTFQPFDNSGHELASGVYFYRVRAGGSSVTRKMLIAR